MRSQRDRLGESSARRMEKPLRAPPPRSARRSSIAPIPSPSDLATVDSGVRHAIEAVGRYVGDGGHPLREHSQCGPRDSSTARSTDSSTPMRTACRATHRSASTIPFWTCRVDDDGRVGAWEENDVFRRQDLPPAYIPDGGVIAVRRDSLFQVDPEHPHAFLGRDRRGVLNAGGAVIDVDDEIDLLVAEAILERRPGGSRGADVDPRGGRCVKMAGVRVGIATDRRGGADLRHRRDRRQSRRVSRPRPSSSIGAAADAGADAVKFQWFEAERLVGDPDCDRGRTSAVRTSANQREMLATTRDSTARRWPVSSRRRTVVGLHAMVTVFSVERRFRSPRKSLVGRVEDRLPGSGTSAAPCGDSPTTEGRCWFPPAPRISTRSADHDWFPDALHRFPALRQRLSDPGIRSVTRGDREHRRGDRTSAWATAITPRWRPPAAWRSRRGR